MDFLINHLISTGVLKSPRVIKAFQSIDRAYFVPENIKEFAYLDEALPIGFNQTISQPYVVAFMIELLCPESGDKIMEIGFGSGWQTTILAQIVSQGKIVSGKIYAVEIVSELCKFGVDNIDKYSFIKNNVVKIFCANGKYGLPEIAKEIGGFDKIIAAATLKEEIPKSWSEQLKIHGTIVAPIKNSIWKFVKKSNGDFDKEEYPGFAFVPFV